MSFHIVLIFLLLQRMIWESSFHIVLCNTRNMKNISYLSCASPMNIYAKDYNDLGQLWSTWQKINAAQALVMRAAFLKLNFVHSYFEQLLQGRGRTVKNLHGCCTFSACFTSFCNFALLNLKLVTIGSGAALAWMTTNKCCPPALVIMAAFSNLWFLHLSVLTWCLYTHRMAMENATLWISQQSVYRVSSLLHSSGQLLPRDSSEKLP